MDRNLLTSLVYSEGGEPAPFPSHCPAFQNRHVAMILVMADRCSSRDQTMSPGHVELLEYVVLQIEQALSSPAGSLGSSC